MASFRGIKNCNQDFAGDEDPPLVIAEDTYLYNLERKEKHPLTLNEYISFTVSTFWWHSCDIFIITGHSYMSSIHPHKSIMADFIEVK